jgi:hypothetical protein
MKRVFNREFVVYPYSDKVVIFNYLTEKGKKNSGKTTICVRTFHPTPSSWSRLEKLTWYGNLKGEMAIDNEVGEMRFVFSGGESLS